MPENKDDGIGLAKFIKAVKDEIIIANERAKNEGTSIFRLGNVDIEMSFVTEKEGNGKIKFLVVAFGGSYKKEQIHRLKITLLPNDEGSSSTTGVSEPKTLPGGKGGGIVIETTTGPMGKTDAGPRA